jgi:hypothetical protein
MNSIASSQPSQQNDAAFAFVQELALGLSRREIELPSFPDVAIRVRKVLSDDDVTAQDIVRVVGSEPALAARIMQMANSAALGHVGKPIAAHRFQSGSQRCDCVCDEPAAPLRGSETYGGFAAGSLGA